MIEALNLYIPSVADREAHQLLQFRRHVVKRWILHTAASGSWEVQYMRRYWSFLGHACRQDFSGRSPARIMLHHIAQQHSETLSRPGPWFTPHSLLTKFWTETELAGDYMLVSSDRESWKNLSSTFLAWQNISPDQANLEILECSPWRHPRSLLRMHVKWLRTVFIGLPTGSFAAAWFDETDGYSYWRLPTQPLDKVESLKLGLQNLFPHLSMLGKPFVLQLAVAYMTDWNYIQEHTEMLKHTLSQCTHASWYQLFPLTASEREHRSVQPCVTYLL